MSLSRPILQPPPRDVESARQRLLAASAPLVEVHSLVRVAKRSRLGFRRIVHEPQPAGRAWLLGEVRWTYAVRPREGGGERTELVLTALSEVAPEYSQHRGFSRVRADRANGGYLTLGGWATLCDWGEVMSRIDDLTTEHG